ncbi:MAG: biotin transporter BioY [Holosporales bacterium]|jgi:biotin transport system substrate-specific component|nr:biotin transporter BioY [Holosporales bacterium]
MIKVKQFKRNEEALNYLKCFICTGLIAICSQICIPFIPVPFTMQTLSVLFVASSLGARYGTIAILMYLVEGAIGIPVFAKLSSGLPVLLGPTGGYLIGFVLAAYITGKLIEKSKTKSFFSLLWPGIAGGLIVLFTGYLRLAYFVGYSRAFTLGVLPFILGDVVKAAVFAAVTMSKFKHM